MDIITAIVRSGRITAVIIEHDMDVVFTLLPTASWPCTRARSSPTGRPTRSGATTQVTANLLGTPEPALMLEIEARQHLPRAGARACGTSRLHGRATRESVCLVGRNGAGKTTTIDSIMGLLPDPQRPHPAGRPGRHAAARPSTGRCSGIGYSPEDAGIFPDLTRGGELPDQPVAGARGAAGRAPPAADGIDERVFALFPEVRSFLQRRGLFLSGGQKKMVAIARAHDPVPSILLLDEPFEGLAPVVVTPLHRRREADQGHGHLAAHRRVEPGDRVPGGPTASTRSTGARSSSEGRPGTSANEDVMKTLRG